MHWLGDRYHLEVTDRESNYCGGKNSSCVIPKKPAIKREKAMALGYSTKARNNSGPLSSSSSSTLTILVYHRPGLVT